jgi:hypothetical protein
VSDSADRDRAQDGAKAAVVPPAAKAAAKRAAAEQEARRRARAEAAPNPTWWAPVFVTLLVLGLIWIVVFYVTQGAWPIQAFGYWNLIVGFGLLLTGFAMTMKWK